MEERAAGAGHLGVEFDQAVLVIEDHPRAHIAWVGGEADGIAHAGEAEVGVMLQQRSRPQEEQEDAFRGEVGVHVLRLVPDVLGKACPREPEGRPAGFLRGRFRVFGL